MTYITTPGHENHNIGKPFHVHHYYIINLSKACPREKEEKNIKLTLFTPKLPRFGMGVMKFIISYLLTLQLHVYTK